MNNALMLLRPLIDALEVPQLAPGAFEALRPAIPQMLENIASTMSRCDHLESQLDELQWDVERLQRTVDWYENEELDYKKRLAKLKQLLLDTMACLKPFVRGPVRVTPESSDIEAGVFEGQALFLTDKHEVHLRLVDGRAIPLAWISKPSLEVETL